MILALVGNQNSGKTTLFNQLTGSNQHVGNFPGVTVEQKMGRLRERPEMTLVDLPGIYSLRPFSSEEILTRDFLLKEKPDGIINIVDATNLERNLYLTLQLLELDLPMVLALNMMDEVTGNGGSIDVDALGKGLGIPVVPISASKKEGLEDLVHQAYETVHTRQRPARKDLSSGPLKRCLHGIRVLVQEDADRAGIPLRFASSKLLEGDEPMRKQLELGQGELQILEHVAGELEQELGTDRNAALADMRYSFIEDLCAASVVKGRESRERLRSIRIDSLLTHKYLAIPIFLLMMLTIFWLTFGVIGTPLSDLMQDGMEALGRSADRALTEYGLNPVLKSLVIDGLFAGVGSVLSFLPIIVTLFFFLSILEDSGYMARVAFVMDKLLRKIGLSGRSFVPMLIGFGCTVPAIMATRTLSSERDRRMTILLTPFMSCSAKLPIYAVFTAAFFPGYPTLVMSVLYLGGMLVGVLCGLVLKHTAYRGKPIPFVMELPNYRFPSAKSVALLIWDKAKDFITRAFTIILLASLIIWFLQAFNYQFNMVENSADSLLATLGQAITPIFAPLGFHDWRIPTALITGFTAKEAVVSTLSVLTGTGMDGLGTALQGFFTPLTAASFLTFTLLYTPCVAAVAAINREMRSLRSALKVVLFQCGVAWVAAMLVYQIGSLLGLS